MEEKRQVYLDYSATTPVKQEVVDEMIPYFTEKFGNASAIYSTGAEAKDALENARARVAALINAEPRECIYLRRYGIRQLGADRHGEEAEK